MMEKMIRPFEGKQIIWRPLDIETESLMVLMKLKTNKSEVVQQFWQEMQEKYAKRIEFFSILSILAKNLVKTFGKRTIFDGFFGIFD